MFILYGLKNCDACRKASAWLTAHGHSHRLHDLRSDGLDITLLTSWADSLEWENLLNRKSTTWRGLADTDKTGLDRDKALALMLAHPALVKRPLLAAEGRLLQGFTPDSYSQAFS